MRPHSATSIGTALLTLFIAAGVATSEAATVPPAQRCASLKLDATARTVVAELGCHARAALLAVPVRPACIAGADEALEASFAQAESRGTCPGVGDAGDVDAMIDGTITSLVETLGGPSSFRRCAAAKLRAAGRLAFRLLGCRRRAVKLGTPVDADCLTRAAARFTLAFDTAERRLDCEASGDAGAVRTTVDAFTALASDRILHGPVSDPAPSNLAAVVSEAQVALSWNAPDPASGKTHVRVLRRLNAAPVDAADPLATEVFFGTATAANDALAALLPSTTTTPRTYHYAAFGCTLAGSCESGGSRTTLAPTIVQALRAGGYVLHWRHAAATICQDQTGLGTAATTSTPNWWKSCDAQCPPGGTATARQIDSTGITQATVIGQQLDTLGIPIGRVVSSEFCRNVTTAALMDFGPTIEQRQDVTFFVYDEAQRCDHSYDLLEEPPAAGTNTAIIGHAGFTCPVLETLAWGEAAIFKPDGAGGSELVTRIVWDAWDDLP
jgi:phosphohistidine phosphatase SixA